MRSVSEIAAAVLDKIPSPRFWVKGQEAAPGQRYCVVGAAQTLRLSSPEMEYFNTEFLGKAAEQFPERRQYMGIPHFNDAEDTRYEDVRMVLEKLIAG